MDYAWHDQFAVRSLETAARVCHEQPKTHSGLQVISHSSKQAAIGLLPGDWSSDCVLLLTSISCSLAGWLRLVGSSPRWCDVCLMPPDEGRDSSHRAR